MMLQRIWMFGWLLAGLAAAFDASSQAAEVGEFMTPAEAATWLEQGAESGGGMMLMLDPPDADAAIAACKGGFTVQILHGDPEKVATIQQQLNQAGVQGPVSVRHFTGDKLPFVDNLVNVLVVFVPADVPADRHHPLRDEAIRVAAPGCLSVVNLTHEGRPAWVVEGVLPTPNDTDQWTHYLHDASNNAVADDDVVGPPRELQWVAPPLWLRSHETPSGVQASVLGDGRLFYIFDEGLIGITDERLPDRWSLVCRDAYNGKLLWKKPLKAWGWREWARDRWEGKDWTVVRAGRTVVPVSNQRSLVIHGDTLYATLEYGGPVSMIDPKSGDVVKTIDATEYARDVIAVGGRVLVYTNPAGFDERAKRLGIQPTQTPKLIALDAGTGEIAWVRELAGGINETCLAAQHGRVVYRCGAMLTGLDLGSGRELWQAKANTKSTMTMVLSDGVAVTSGANVLDAYDMNTGELLWTQKLPGISGFEARDLFIVDGLVWRGVVSVQLNEKGEIAGSGGKSANALLVGYDLRTGEKKREVLSTEIRSPEHHHRCYRNKATTNYMMTGMEGIEMIAFNGEGHSQNNWLRGACKYGITPANGMIYVPPDQCFCHPGSKVLGYTAVKAASEQPLVETPDGERLVKGPAYGELSASVAPKATDWPTFRHDAKRSGSTMANVSADVSPSWRIELGGELTAPVMADGRVYVASKNEHIVYALDAMSGKELWGFTAGGRVDSPPTIIGDAVLFGSKDGRVYCLRASDGELAWSFLAAPADRQLAAFDQFESVWPVHGSVLVENGLAYVSAGRSTYLDGGIRLWGLNPMTGEIVHKGLLEGPFPEQMGQREVSFYTLGANSDVLVSDGENVYMRQKSLLPDLQEIPDQVLSSKGELDMSGMHLFSTAGLLDPSWYNRAFWMFSTRWPGFQLANQAPKTGQLLVFDDEKTYALRVFYHRNVHSPMFFPGTEGYLLFADLNTTEPQIVGEEGAKTPVRWLPQSDYSKGKPGPLHPLDSAAFGLDKMIGYTRNVPPLWRNWVPIRVRAMTKADDKLFVVGPPDVFEPSDPFAAFEGRRGARLAMLSAKDGAVLGDVHEFDAEPVFDGLIAADGALFVSLKDGSVMCMRPKE